MSVKVKICGVANSEDAAAAAEAGADLVGFNFYGKSLRHVTWRIASEACQVLPPHIVRVGLFVNASPEQVAEAIRHCGLQMLQFHGDESPEYCLQFGIMSMKAFRMKDASVLEELTHYRTDAWLLDAYVPGQHGGTGKSFDWDLAARAVELGRPVFLAGGLNPENVGEAIQRVRPYGVDVSGGVESAPGRKDSARMREFVRAAKAATGHDPSQDPR